MARNSFIGLSATDLNTLKTTYLQAITDIGSTGQSIAIPGRNLTRANLIDIKATLGEINEAIAMLNGTRKTSGTFRFGGV